MTLAETLSRCERIFVDTAPVIYHLEAHPVYGPLARQVVEAMDHEIVTAFTSVITLTEVLPHPVAREARDLVDQTLQFLRYNERLKLLDISADLAVAAGRLRGRYRFLRTVDALQLAGAQAVKADAFITNDRELKKVGAIRVIVLQDFLAPDQHS